MADFDLATGYVQFKGDLTKLDADIEKARLHVAELDKALNTEAGRNKFKMALSESKRLNEELARSNKLASRMMDEVRLGKMGVLVRDLNKGMNHFASIASRAGAVGVGIGGAALTAGAGGSPLAQSTLQGSFDLLMTEVGGTFTPLVKDVSKAMQDARKTWRGMSDEMKGFLNEGAKFIGIAGLASLGLAAVAKGLTLLAAHPIIATLAGGVGILSLQESSLKKKDQQITDAKKWIYNTTEADAAKGWQGQKLAGMKPEDAKAEAGRLFDRKWRDYEAARMAHEDMSSGLRGLLTPESDQMEQAKRVTVLGKELEEAKINYNKYGGGNLKKREGGGKGEDILLGARGPASMTDVNGLFKSFQLAGASGNQLEAEKIRTQMENEQRMLENSGKQVELLAKIADNLPLRK